MESILCLDYWYTEWRWDLLYNSPSSYRSLVRVWVFCTQLKPTSYDSYPIHFPIKVVLVWLTVLFLNSSSVSSFSSGPSDCLSSFESLTISSSGTCRISVYLSQSSVTTESFIEVFEDRKKIVLTTLKNQSVRVTSECP